MDRLCRQLGAWPINRVFCTVSLSPQVKEVEAAAQRAATASAGVIEEAMAAAEAARRQASAQTQEQVAHTSHERC